MGELRDNPIHRLRSLRNLNKDSAVWRDEFARALVRYGDPIVKLIDAAIEVRRMPRSKHALYDLNKALGLLERE